MALRPMQLDHARCRRGHFSPICCAFAARVHPTSLWQYAGRGRRPIGPTRLSVRRLVQPPGAMDKYTKGVVLGVGTFGKVLMATHKEVRVGELAM